MTDDTDGLLEATSALVPPLLTAMDEARMANDF